MGHFRTLVLAVLSSVAMIAAVVVAAAMCVVFTAGSAVLWVRGLWDVLQWLAWRTSDDAKSVSGETEKHPCPTAMPGQEHGSHWKHAWWNVAKRSNYRIRAERESVHFNVAPLLTSTTGLDLERLSLLIKRGDDNTVREKDITEIDRAAASGHLLPVLGKHQLTLV